MHLLRCGTKTKDTCSMLGRKISTKHVVHVFVLLLFHENSKDKQRRRLTCAPQVLEALNVFLARRLENFSDFLMDDSVTTRLAREVTAFTAPSDVQRPRKVYAVEWGQTLANEFREYYGLEEETSQNVSAGGISFLDDYRSLITEIGNGLGLVFLLTQGRQQFRANLR